MIFLVFDNNFSANLVVFCRFTLVYIFDGLGAGAGAEVRVKMGVKVGTRVKVRVKATF